MAEDEEEKRALLQNIKLYRQERTITLAPPDLYVKGNCTAHTRDHLSIFTTRKKKRESKKITPLFKYWLIGALKSDFYSSGVA